MIPILLFGAFGVGLSLFSAHWSAAWADQIGVHQPVYIQDCPSCPQMAVVPAQTIQLGSDHGRPEEAPAYMFTLGNPIAVSVTEVTFDQWQPCVDADVCPFIERDNGWGRSTRPVIRMTYAEAVSYADWLSGITKQTYRLPTESEWEIAARAGATTRYSWGHKMLPGYAHCRFCDQTDLTHLNSTWLHQTVPVGSLTPNTYGLYDMVGNVWEWTSVCWTPTHQQTGTAKSTDCKNHAVRGGSWYFFGVVAGSPARSAQVANLGSYDIGIRLVRELTQQDIEALPKSFLLKP